MHMLMVYKLNTMIHTQYRPGQGRGAANAAEALCFFFKFIINGTKNMLTRHCQGLRDETEEGARVPWLGVTVSV